MLAELNKIAQILGKNHADYSNRLITMAITDSRSVFEPENTLFFALHTATNDGHRFIPELYNRGVRAFVVNHIPDNASTIMPEAEFIETDNVVKALQTLAKAIRHEFNGTVIAITGSYGKTEVKEWLYQILNKACPTYRSPRSYNSQIGVPLSITRMDNSDTIAIIEAGISRQGEMATLADIIRPNIAIFTNIGAEHNENFEGNPSYRLRQKADEKALLSEGSNVVVNSDSEIMNRALNSISTSNKLDWSLNSSCRAFANISTELSDNGNATTIKFSTADNRSHGHATVRFTAAHDIENLCSVIATVLALDEQLDGRAALLLEQTLPELQHISTRADILEGRDNSIVIHDHFGTDLISLPDSIDMMRRRVTPQERATVILGRLTSDINNSPFIFSNQFINRIITVTPLPELKKTCLENGVEFISFENEEMLAAAIDSGELKFSNELVLVKANASKGELNAVVERIEARLHETVLEVNLNSIVHNFNFYKSRLRESTGIVAMIKASGYGAGSYELAKTLQSQGAAYLAVAVLDEGLDLRKAGITMPIMVLNPRVVNYDALFDNNLEPEVFSFDELDEIIRQAAQRGITNYPIHLKFDTGMHRLGFLGDDIPLLIDRLKSHNEVEVRSMFSHLAAADDPALDDYTLGQFAKFEAWTDEVMNALPGQRILRHILNSTGITRFPQYQYDMVRLGICLYGIATMDDGSQNGLIPVSALYTNIISIKHWPAGTTIGYNRKGVCHRDSIIATIPIGYADGINRHLGNGGMKVWINGTLCPIIGNICMDACMVDITDCATECRVGDRVEIFGHNAPVTAISDSLDTIPYEILTSVSMRVKRVYFRE